MQELAGGGPREQRHLARARGDRDRAEHPAADEVPAHAGRGPAPPGASLRSALHLGAHPAVAGVASRAAELGVSLAQLREVVRGVTRELQQRLELVRDERGEVAWNGPIDAL